MIATDARCQFCDRRVITVGLEFTFQPIDLETRPSAGGSWQIVHAGGSVVARYIPVARRALDAALYWEHACHAR